MQVIAIFGPTGVGKTAVAIALAERLRRRGEDPIAVSADALQVYEGLGVLTGAPSASERERLEHRLVGTVPVTRSFSAGEFADLAHAEIDEALAAGRRPIVVGGTGLYLQAALCDLDLRPPPPPQLRAKLDAAVRTRGAAALHSDLAVRAPEVAAAIAPGDRSRIVRALELIEMGEEPAPMGEGSKLWTAELRHPTLLCGLVMEREALYRRIDERTEEIAAAGGGDEARRADELGASATARQALGFDELPERDVEGLKRRTRTYAKRQLTWMRKLPGVEAIDVTDRSAEDVAVELERRVNR